MTDDSLLSKFCLSLPADYDEVFSILNQDHSFFLGCVVENKTYGHDELLRAAVVMQRSWRRYEQRRVYFYLKGRLCDLSRDDPVRLLKRANAVEAELFEKSYGNQLMFRLAGEVFPPFIVYKVFTGQSIVNLHGKSNSHVTYSGKKKTKAKHYEWKSYYVYRKALRVQHIDQTDYKFNCNLQTRTKKRSRIQWIREMYNF